jgi:hypothetical protein
MNTNSTVLWRAGALEEIALSIFRPRACRRTRLFFEDELEDYRLFFRTTAYEMRVRFYSC